MAVLHRTARNGVARDVCRHGAKDRTAKRLQRHSVLGKSRTGKAVLLDQIRGKWEAPELLVHARAFWAKHKAGAAPLRAFKVEDKVSGTGLIQTLKREGIPMVAIQRDRDKVTRAYDAAPMIESGNVLLPRNAAFLSDLLAEATVFPNGAHDDQLDPLFDAISDMTQGPQSDFFVI